MSNSRPLHSRLEGRVPAIGWLSHYDRRWLPRDVVSGVTTAAVVIPQAMAYAALAGLPIQIGLYAALVPMVVYAVLGTSRVLSVSVSSTVSILTAEAIAGVRPDEAPARAAGLAVMVGLVLIVSGILRLGFAATFISQPVLIGFKIGAGLLIASSQLGKVFGIPVEGDGFFARIWSATTQLDDVHGWTFALALAAFVLIVVLRRWLPSAVGPIVAVVGGIVAVRLADLTQHGVTTIGSIPSGLPGFAVPALHDATSLFAPALGIALMAFVESIAAARTFAQRDEPRIDASQELVALGAASFAGGFFQAYPVSGGLSQTAINRQSGAKTQMSALATVAVVILTLTVLTPIFEGLADAVLGALVLVAALGLVDLVGIRRLSVIRRRDFFLAVVAAVAVLIFGVLQGVLVGVAVSMLVLLHESTHPAVDRLGQESGTGRWRVVRADQPFAEISGLLVVRTYGRLFFANSERVIEQIRALISTTDGIRVVLFDAEAVPDLEATAIQDLVAFKDELRDRGIELWIASVYAAPRAMIHRAAGGEEETESFLFPDLERAVQRFRAA